LERSTIRSNARRTTSLSRKCAACEDEQMQRSAQAPAAVGMPVAPAAVHRVLTQPGRPLDAVTRAFFEPRFGQDFGSVRVHDDALAAQSARAVGARAYTVGNDIAFADTVDTGSERGRRLIAHELTHTIQQGDGASPRLRRDVPGTTEPDPMKDPDCPAERPYRWGPKRGPDTADPAVVAPCMAIPMPRSQPNPIDPDIDDGESSPNAPRVPTPQQDPHADSSAGTASVPVASTDSVADNGPVKAEDNADTGSDFEDDPLSTGGFGPDDATIRVRPGPVRSTLLRPQDQASPECPYETRQIASFGDPAGPMNLPQLANDVTEAFTHCGIAYVSIDVIPRPGDADPNDAAMERAQSIKQQLMEATGPGKFAEDRFYTGLSTGGPGEPQVSVWLGTRNEPRYGGAGLDDNRNAASQKNQGVADRQTGPADPDKVPPQQDSGPSVQVSAQLGGGDTWHFYATRAGANDKLHEWMSAAVVAYTRQLHDENKSGEERQMFAQLQQSLSTGQWTLGVGVQESYVYVLPRNLQLSFWAQVMVGRNVSTGTTQSSLSGGAQFAAQPKKWLTLGGQLGVGPTMQSSGPNSIDLGGLVFIQIQSNL
jgi:Domain of unknown function (DUF4157)